MPCPDSVRLEVKIAVDRPFDKAEVARLGANDADLPGRRRRASADPPVAAIAISLPGGHAFAREALESDDQENVLDDAMRAALCIVEKRAILTEKTALQAHRTRMRLSAADYDKRSGGP